MTHSEIIDALGGTGAVAALTESAQQSVTNWRTRGIPWRKRPAVARAAKAKRVTLPADFLVDL